MTTPKYFFLLPGTVGRWWSGGTETFLKLASVIGEHRETEVVVYASEEPDHRSLDTVLRDDPAGEHIWVFTTGVDVPALVERLEGRRKLYYALESGWRLQIPAGVSIICASRAALAQLSERMEGNPTYFLPIALGHDVENQGLARDIDVLHIARKSTSYLRDELIPALERRCHVETVDSFLPRQEVLQHFNRSKVYLYDSRSSFADGVVEGFGLQPLEALVCGCVVMCNLAGGMGDFLEPGVNCHRLQLVLEEDLRLCLRAVQGRSSVRGNGEELRRRYSEEALRNRLALLLPEIEGLPFTRSEAMAREIERHVSGARQDAEQPLYTEIRDRGRIIESLQAELQAKVSERDVMIRSLQAELVAKVRERDVMIRSLQAELVAKVSERDVMIRSLQADLAAASTERRARDWGVFAGLRRWTK